MTSITFDDLIIDTPQDTFISRDFSEDWNGDILENTDGNLIYVSEYIFYSTKVRRRIMSLDFTKPPTLGAAIGLGLIMLVGIGGIGGIYYSLIRGDITDLRAELSSVRDSAGGDVKDLRVDTRQDFGKVNDKLDNVTKILTEMRIEQARRDSNKPN